MKSSENASNTGRKRRKAPYFPYTEEQLEEIIEQYKQDLKEEKFARASWPHFCSYLHMTEPEVARVVRYGDRPDDDANTYTIRSRILKRMCTWVRGQYASAKGWSGQNQSRAIFLMKQSGIDGVAYSDQPQSAGVQEVRVTFGGSDPRAKKAAK